MDVFLKTGPDRWNAGSRAVVTAFFDTLACRLEPQGRGTRFPIVSQHLRLGYVSPRDTARAFQEMAAIVPELRQLPPGKILGAASLNAPDGRPLADLFREAMERSLGNGQPITLTSPVQPKDVFGGIFLALIGPAWTIAGLTWFPNGVLATRESPHGGLLVWTAGLLMTGAGLAVLTGRAIPPLRIWFTLHPGWAGALAVAAVLLWMVLGYAN
jgi:hypothetical protein